MEEINENTQGPSSQNNETSIFDELKPMPEYYSERAIYGSSIFFGVFFGSILMAINLKNTESKKGVWQVVVFGFVYTIVQIAVASIVLNKSTGLSIALSIPGAYLLKTTFWNKYIGKGVLYSKKSMLIPMSIGIALMLAYLYIILHTPA